MNLRKIKGFTLIEILIVIAIIAILAATIVPDFIGFDSEARVTTSKSNLEVLRVAVNLFRAKEGKYPETLEDLTTSYYFDLGVKKPYLKKMPAELMSGKKGNTEVTVLTESDKADGRGGWIYVTDTAEVKINVSGQLGEKWGSYKDDDPSEW